MAEVPVSGNRALSDYVFIGDIQSVSDIVVQYEFQHNTLPGYSTRSSRTPLPGS